MVCLFVTHYIPDVWKIKSVAPDWVLAQTIERKRKELEADEMERLERLLKARKKESSLRKAALNRFKRVVSIPLAQNEELGLS